MSQKFLRPEQPMSLVELAAEYANRMIECESHGPGDTESAMRRIEAKSGIGYWTLWALRYRRRDMKMIAADQYQRIRNAYLASCERQISTLQHTLAVEKARCADDDHTDLVAQATDLVAQATDLVAKLKAARKTGR